MSTGIKGIKKTSYDKKEEKEFIELTENIVNYIKKISEELFKKSLGADPLFPNREYFLKFKYYDSDRGLFNLSVYSKTKRRFFGNKIKLEEELIKFHFNKYAESFILVFNSLLYNEIQKNFRSLFNKFIENYNGLKVRDDS